MGTDILPLTGADALPAATYQGLFPAEHDRLSQSGAMANETSPLNYLRLLYEKATGLEGGSGPQARTLARRRPDLAGLMLDQASLNRTESTLARTVDLLKQQVRSALGRDADIMTTLASELAPIGLPFHAPWDRIRTTLDARHLTLWQVLRKTDRDYPSFLADARADADLPRALALGTRLPPALHEALVAEPVDETTAVSRFSSRADATLYTLASVPAFMRASGLTRREVRHLLAVQGPGTAQRKRSAVKKSAYVTHDVEAAASDVYGAYYINHASNTEPMWLSESTDGKAGNTRIERLDAPRLDRAYRLLQVRAALELTVADADLLMSSIDWATETPDEPSAEADGHHALLRALGLYGHLADTTAITPEQFAAFVDEITIYTASHTPPFYDRLFARTQGTALVINGDAFMDGATMNTDAIALLARGLKVDVLTTTLALTMVRQVAGVSRVTRDLATVSACYRLIELPRLFGLTPMHGLQLIELLNRRDPTFLSQLAGIPSIRARTAPPGTDILDVIVGLWNAADWVQQHAVDMSVLYECLRDDLPATAPSEWLTTLDAHAEAIAAACQDAAPDVSASDREKRRSDIAYLVLADAFGLRERELAAHVLAWCGMSMDAFLDSLHTVAGKRQAGERVQSVDITADVLRSWCGIQRHGLLATTWSLSAPAVAAMTRDHEAFNLAPWTAEAGETRRPLHIGDIYRIASYTRWVSRLPKGVQESDALAYLAAIRTDGAPAPDDAARRVEALIGWPWQEVRTLGRALHPSPATGVLTSLADIDLALRMRDLHKKLGVSCGTLCLLGQLGPTSTFNDVDAVAAALTATGTDTVRTHATRAHLAHWRDALCRWLLHHWAGTHEATHDIDDRAALSVYLLTDVDVGPEPDTTPVAHAIASLQQYIHRLYAQLEPYFKRFASFESERRDWLAWYSQYPLWKLHTQMRRHPEDYLDPTQRTRKTAAFADMEKLVAQGKFKEDDVQIALLTYLSTFEQVSNIQPLSCYEDGTEPLRDTFHFIGCTNIEPTQYYWRTLDMSLRAPDGSPSVLAWGEWEKIGLPLAGVMAKTRLLNDEKGKVDGRSTIDTIRPVVIAGRRYVVWLERETSPLMWDEIGVKEKAGKSAYFVFRLCYAFLQTDGLWSSSNELIRLDGLNDSPAKDPAEVDARLALLKTIDYRPHLAVMTYEEGDERANDPWLIAMLFDEAKLGEYATSIGENITTINKTLSDGSAHFVAARDLLLLDNKTVDNATRLIQHWYQVFRDPRTVQHDYKGVKSAVKLKEGEPPARFTLKPGVSIKQIDRAAPEALYLPSLDCRMESSHSARLQCTLRPPQDIMKHAPRYVALTANDDFEKVEIAFINDTLHVSAKLIDKVTLAPQTLRIRTDKKSGPVLVNDNSHGDFFEYILGLAAEILDLISKHADDPVASSIYRLDQTIEDKWHELDRNIMGRNTGRYGSVPVLDWNDVHELNGSLIECLIPVFQAFDETNFAVNGGTAEITSPVGEEHPSYVIVEFVGSQRDGSKACVVAVMADERGQRFVVEPLYRRIEILVYAQEEHHRVCSPARVPVAGQATSGDLVLEGLFPLRDGVTDYPVTIHMLDDNNNIIATASATVVWTGTAAAGSTPVDDKVASVKLAHNSRDVHWIDFDEANKDAGDGEPIPCPRLRLNTLFGKDLVARATQSTSRALAWDTQQLTEPAIGDTASAAREKLDLNGANGIYFRELFFHMPWLVAWRLRESRQFRDAQDWCVRQLFDPYPGDDQADRTGYWRARPLAEPNPVLPVGTPLKDPLLSAYTDRECYQRAVFHFLVELWRMEGDDYYRQMTRDSLAQAWLCYEKATRLIGRLPEALASESWTPVRLDRVSGRAFFPAPDEAIVATQRLIEQRFHNLRHGLTLDGKRAILPMYAEPPAFDALGNPRAGLAAPPSLGRQWQVPHFRYLEVLPRAREAAQRLTDFGRRLFELYEKEFDAGLAVMFQDDAIALNEYAIILQRQQLDQARVVKGKLKAARRQVEKRFERYDGLFNAGLLHNETAKITLSLIGQMITASSAPIDAAEAGAKMVPTIFGMAVGGAHTEALLSAIKTRLLTTGGVFGLASEAAGWQAEIDRRYQEWDAERNAATYELDTIDEEIRAQSIEVDSAKLALEEVLQRHDLMKKEYVFMTTGFAIGPTYIWMIARLSNIYAAMYDAVYALCEAANAAYDFETDLTGTLFVKPTAWSDPWRGMLAGEALERNLLEMDAAYIHRHERRFLVEREISLAALKGRGDIDAGIQCIINELESDGAVSFDLTHELFDGDYPGHYLRRIKHISVALAVSDDLVPMAGAAAAVLTQRSSSIVTAPDIDAVKWHYMSPKDKSALAIPGSVRLNLLPEQYSAVSASTGNSDITTQLSVLGKILFDDDRRLAFEGTGAVSSWTLTFTGRPASWMAVLKGPDKTNDASPPDAWRLKDIKVRLHYTAAVGSEAFTKQVTAEREKTRKLDIPSQRWSTRTAVPGSTTLAAGMQPKLPDEVTPPADPAPPDGTHAVPPADKPPTPPPPVTPVTPVIAYAPVRLIPGEVQGQSAANWARAHEVVSLAYNRWWELYDQNPAGSAGDVEKARPRLLDCYTSFIGDEATYRTAHFRRTQLQVTGHDVTVDALGYLVFRIKGTYAVTANERAAFDDTLWVDADRSQITRHVVTSDADTAPGARPVLLPMSPSPPGSAVDPQSDTMRHWLESLLGVGAALHATYGGDIDQGSRDIERTLSPFFTATALDRRKLDPLMLILRSPVILACRIVPQDDGSQVFLLDGTEQVAGRVTARDIHLSVRIALIDSAPFVQSVMHTPPDGIGARPPMTPYPPVLIPVPHLAADDIMQARVTWAHHYLEDLFGVGTALYGKAEQHRTDAFTAAEASGLTSQCAPDASDAERRTCLAMFFMARPTFAECTVVSTTANTIRFRLQGSHVTDNGGTPEPFDVFVVIETTTERTDVMSAGATLFQGTPVAIPAPVVNADAVADARCEPARRYLERLLGLGEWLYEQCGGDLDLGAQAISDAFAPHLTAMYPNGHSTYARMLVKQGIDVDVCKVSLDAAAGLIFTLQGTYALDGNGTRRPFDYSIGMDAGEPGGMHYVSSNAPPGVGNRPSLIPYPPVPLPALSTDPDPSDTTAIEAARAYLEDIYGVGAALAKKHGNDLAAAIQDAKEPLRKQCLYPSFESVEYRRNRQLLVKIEPTFSATMATIDSKRDVRIRLQGTALSGKGLVRMPFDEFVVVETAKRLGIVRMGVSLPTGTPVTIPAPSADPDTPPQARWIDALTYLQSIFEAGTALFAKYQGDIDAASKELLYVFGHEIPRADDDSDAYAELRRCVFQPHSTFIACNVAQKEKDVLVFTLHRITAAQYDVPETQSDVRVLVSSTTRSIDMISLVTMVTVR